MTEDKQAILNDLEKALNQCRITGSDMIGLIYDGKNERVLIYRNNEAYDTVNVACDSGIAMIRDVLKHPYFN